MDAPETTAGELLRLINGLAGRRPARVIFWLFIVFMTVYAAPIFMDRVDLLAIEFTGSPVPWDSLPLNDIFRWAFIGILLVALAILTILFIAALIGAATRDGRRRRRRGSRRI